MVVVSNEGIHPLNLGIIPYWNLLPLKQELLKPKVGAINIKSGTPANVNAWLNAGDVRLAPCSSVCLVTNPGFEMALPMGVASNGAVQSVYLGFQKEHLALLQHIETRQQQLRTLFQQAQAAHGFDARQITNTIWDTMRGMDDVPLAQCPTLKFSAASASGAFLTRIFYALWFGLESYKGMALRKFVRLNDDHGGLELVIGDEALKRRSSFAAVLDLGALWKEFTDLPFVFAVWQSKGACLNGWRRKILEIGELTERRMKSDPQYYLPGELPRDDKDRPIQLADYWKAINYRLGPDELRGLLIFLCLTRQLLATPLDTNMVVKIMRWQEICQQNAMPNI